MEASEQGVVALVLSSREKKGGPSSSLLEPCPKPRSVAVLTRKSYATQGCVLCPHVSQLYTFCLFLNTVPSASLGWCFSSARWVVCHVCPDSSLVNFSVHFLKDVSLTLLFIAFQWWQVEKVNPIKLYEENKVIAGFSLLNLLFKQNRGGLIKGVMDKLLNLYTTKKIKPVVDSLWALEEVGAKFLSSFLKYMEC